MSGSHTRCRRAQLSVELIIVSIAVLSVFVTMFAIINYRNNDITSMKQYLDAKDIGDKVAWDLNEVYLSGFGTRRYLTIPNTTSDDTQVTVEVYPLSRMVKVSWEQRFYTAPLVTSRIAGDINGNSSFNITLVPGALNITNILGEINLAQ